MMLSATDTVQTQVAPQQRKPLVALATEAALLITEAAGGNGAHLHFCSSSTRAHVYAAAAH